MIEELMTYQGNKIPPEADQFRLRIAEQIAELWNKRRIPYAVINGLNNYPAKVGRDLDVILERSQVPIALFLIYYVARKNEWTEIWTREMFYGLYHQVYLGREVNEKYVAIEIDLMCEETTFIAAGISLAGIKEILKHLERKGPFKISPLGYYLKSQLRPILYGDFNRFKTRYNLQQIPDRAVSQKLITLFGERNLNYYNWLIKGGISELSKKYHSLKLKMITYYALHHPLKFICNVFITKIYRPICLYLFDHGSIIAVVGPDGIGKSTAIRQAIKYLSGGLFHVRLKHWRPSLLPPPAFLVKKEVDINPVKHLQRGIKGWVTHWLRIIYYWLDFLLGHFIKDRFVAVSEVPFTLYDRCALDMVVDPSRYKLLSPKGTILSIRLAPGPEKIILLIDTSQNIRDRKQELSLSEIKHQLHLWNKLKQQGKIHSTISVDGSPEEVGRKLALDILKFLNSKYDIRQTRIWKESLKLYGYTEVSISSTARLSFPSNLPKESLRYALNLYTPHKMISRCLFYFVRNLLLIGMHPHNIKFEFSPSRLLDGWNLQNWLHKIEKIVKEKKLRTAFLFPYQNSRKKAACLLLNQISKPVGFAKLAWSDLSKEELHNEIRALRKVKQIGFQSFQIPQVITSNEDEESVLWNFYTLLPFNSRKQRASWDVKMNDVWLEMKRKTEHHLMTNQISWLERLTEQGSLWEKAVSALKEKEPKTGYSFCMAHGDMAPWNMLCSKGKLWLYDWENFSTSAPLYTDPVYFHLRCAMLLKNYSPEKAIKTLHRLQIDGANIGISDLLLTLGFLRMKQGLFSAEAMDEMVKNSFKLLLK